MSLTHHARRIAAAAAIAGAALVLPAVALAASSGAAAPAAAATGRCQTADLTDWLGFPASQTAGSTYYELEISNISHHACTLYGFAGVSAVRGGHQLGSAAGRDDVHPDRLLTLAPGGTVHAILQITDVYNFSPSSCRPEQAVALRVYAPGDYHSHLVPLTFTGCAKSGPVYLHVTTTLAGAGIPGYSF
jgi:Protein of unknown function (DUF4232)